MPRSRAFLVVSVVAALAVLDGRAARADRASAAAALPEGPEPFLLVTSRKSTSGAFDDLPAMPEYAAYADGTFLVQKSDEHLWAGRLSRDQVLDLMDFLLADASIPSIDMRYILSSPLTTFTEYTLRTRSGKWSVRKRSSGGVGLGVSDGEKALKRVDQRLVSMADGADKYYEPGRLYVASQRVSVDMKFPLWTFNERLPFAALSAGTDVDRAKGAVLEGEDAATVARALAESAAWRFGGIATDFRARPALPEEATVPAWHNPAGGTKAPAVPVPPAVPPQPVVPTQPASPPPAPTPAPAQPAPAGNAASDWRADDVDFQGVIALLAGLKQKTTGSPHGTFWKKPYGEFCGLTFDSGDGKLRLFVRGDGAHSNLVKAMKGEPLTITLPDGSTKEESFLIMPPKGPPMPAADIERIRRWIDHGAPETKPAAGGPPADAAPPAPPPTPPAPPPDATAPVPPPPPAPPPAPPPPAGTPPAPPVPAPAASEPAPTSQTVALVLVGEGVLDLGDKAPGDDGNAPPSFYVACNDESWSKVFDVFVRTRSGRNGATVAERLAPYRDAAKGWNWAGSPLLVLVGPTTDNYTMEVGPRMEILSDGSGRVSVTHRHEPRDYIKAPSQQVRWAIYRAEAKCPPLITIRANGTKTYGPYNRD